MNPAALELVALPVRALRRGVVWWAIGLAAMIALTMAFWPAFKGSGVIQQGLDMVPPALVQAFGLQDFLSPEGYLRGNLYAILVPLLLVLAAVSAVGSQTAGEEAAGRLELYLAKPVDRRWAGYLVAALFPLSDVLAPWRHLSPWDWALGGDPLLHAAEPWRYAALVVPTVGLVVLGMRAFGRRDVAAA